MSGFSPEWLDLREPADHRSRDAGLLKHLAGLLTLRGGGREVQIVDLGCGTGSNLRAAAPSLPARQHWTLVDYDPALLVAARTRLTAWADRAGAAGDGLELHKGERRIRVSFRQADLARDLEAALGEGMDAVTASALFDLCSAEFMTRFAAATARRNALFYTVLTYNGIQRWTPEHSCDAVMLDAFHAHQTTDKGFGRSAGPGAARLLAEVFRGRGHELVEADTPWVLGEQDGRLVAELQAGFAGAVRETGRVAAEVVAAWSALPRTGAVVGHTDTLALPPG